jgi:uncharacterized protein (TIGR00369 family)
VTEPSFEAGQRFSEMITTSGDPGYPGIWSHLGWKVERVQPGRATLTWDAHTDHAFSAGDDWIIHGGMVTALLDTAVGQATWSLLNNDEVFLTADLRTEFYRPARPGLLRASGWVVHKTRRITFAAGEAYDTDDKLLASVRVTNMTIKLTQETA